MKRICLEHLGGAFVISLILLILYLLSRPLPNASKVFPGPVQSLAERHLDPNDPFQKQLFHDFVRSFAPQDSAQFLHYWQLFAELNKAQAQLTQTRYRQKMASRRSPAELFSMYINFILIYLVVMALTYYGVQTLGIYLFLKFKQHRPPALAVFFSAWRQAVENPTLKNIKHGVVTSLKQLGTALGYMALFTPAYVIAYSIKSDFDTESVPFMILLGVVSNGVLITYANKFFHFLLNESRKGYVQTAIVKNLNHDYGIGAKQGIRLRSLLALRKNFEGHVLEHIFMNARFQYLATFKEQAAFIITGLIIIEMALNIHGHLSYELLQQLLYQNYDLAILIIWGIFLLVKLTEWFTDVVLFRQKKRMGYE